MELSHNSNGKFMEKFVNFCIYTKKTNVLKDLTAILKHICFLSLSCCVSSITKIYLVE